MGFWTREKKDGQKTAGYGVFLTAGVLSVAFVIYVATKISAPQATLQQSAARPAVVKIGDTATAATGMRQAVDEDRPLTAAEISTRGIPDANPNKHGSESAPSGSSAASTSRSIGTTAVTPAPQDKDTAPSGGIESINVAMRIAEDAAKPQLDEGTGLFPAKPGDGSRYTPLQRTVWISQDDPNGVNARSGNSANVQSSNSMVVYSASSDRELATEKAAANDKSKASTNRSHVLPKGEWIPCYLLTTVDEGEIDDSLIELGVAANVYFNHRLQIPFGTRIFAETSGKSIRMRMGLNATGIRYPNGLELPLSGAVRGEDRAPGVPAYYIAASNWAQLSPYVSSFIGAWIEAEKQAARGPSLGSVVTALVGEAQTKPFDPEAESRIAAATGLNDLIKARIKDVQDRFGAHLVIPAGTMVWVQLTDDADLTASHTQPERPWTEAQPQATQVANLTRSLNNQRRAAANAATSAVTSLNGTGGSAIDRLINATANGEITPEQAQAALSAAAQGGEKSTPASVITPPTGNSLPADASDFFPKSNP